jgi:hypothetical protein
VGVAAAGAAGAAGEAAAGAGAGEPAGAGEAADGEAAAGPGADVVPTATAPASGSVATTPSVVVARGVVIEVPSVVGSAADDDPQAAARRTKVAARERTAADRGQISSFIKEGFLSVKPRAMRAGPTVAPRSRASTTGTSTPLETDGDAAVWRPWCRAF